HLELLLNVSSVSLSLFSGQDEQSAQLMSSWEDDKVSEAAQNSCVAIKVDAKSETCVQFSQIYPVVCIPSSFFIGENGIPLEVIAGTVPAEELKKRISRVKQVWAQNWISCSFIISKLRFPLWLGQATLSTIHTIYHKCVIISSYCPVRLTKKLEERREQRKTGEEENVIKKEIERRKVGKDMQDFKRKQEEEKTKRLLEERNRERAEEKAARARVKQQIALDRADRAARYAKTQEEEKAAKQALLHARQAEQEVRKEALLRERSTIARIQFRLPDGSSFTNQFTSQSRLQEARNFAAQEVGNRYGNFSLATMFPRREFTSEDLDKTLLELELAPSASIVVLPSGRPANAVVQSSGGSIWAVLGTLLYPLLAVWRFLSSFLFATPPPPGAASRGPAHQSNSYTNSASASDKAKREIALEKRPKDFKKDGKICRLRTQEDSEDDNNTWNGNSTQQM
uniref:UBX domain-containing protein 4 n=1 Tax=Dicentrarchus labrax TaxID=13489 RepID=A0A8P4K467_DICLA